MEKYKPFKSSAVIVTYFPDADVVPRIIKMSSLVDLVYVVDNTPEIDCKSISAVIPSNVSVLTLGENKGIATALNCGADLAFKDGADFVFSLIKTVIQISP